MNDGMSFSGKWSKTWLFEQRVTENDSVDRWHQLVKQRCVGDVAVGESENVESQQRFRGWRGCPGR